MKKRKFMRMRSVTEGMRIDQNVLDKTGRTLIAKGTYLDDFMIDALLKKGVTGIYTSEGEDEPDEENIPIETREKIEKLTVKDPVKVKLSESVKKRVSEGIQYLYNNTSSENFTSASRNIADDLMKTVLENDSIAFDIGALKVSDEYTFKHSVDVATMAMVIARHHGLSRTEIHTIGITGLLHDVGKSKIPNEVLNKPAKLTDEEFELMKQHTVLGYKILKEKNDLKEEVRLGVLQHHEKINGRGYPLGLSEEKINPYAKILSVADIYDALVTKRPYKNPFSQRDAIEMIMSMTSELDIDIMKSFLSSVILYPVGCSVKLSNGENAKVVENNPECILRPKVVEFLSGRVYDLARDLNCANIVIL